MPTACSPEGTSARPRVAVIVLHLDAEDETRNCLRALAASRYPNSTTYLLDNGSRRPLGAIDTAPKRLERVRSSTNLGFAGGANHLADRALSDGADHLLFLNNDAQVESDTIDRLVEQAAVSRFGGIFGARILAPSGAIESDGERVRLRWLRRRALLAPSDDPIEVDAVLGCGMLVTRSVVDSIGLFDERYFAYFEEIDLCLRARRSGFPVVTVPRARVVHRGFGSTGGSVSPRAAYLRARNAKLLVRKLGSPIDRACFAAVYPAAIARRSLRFIAGRRLDLAAATLRGALARSFGPPHSLGSRQG
ncbi:MAG: glycosyltransferase family 2 protein [Planctomycetes bacterium]|nr:glycosyltransferase family 2 protein [Planctomycetota bacterium]MBI3846261.1 glycosyltransferase family 2 protein [Planctomycetota bacterium]